jgi:hypothetical protein
MISTELGTEIERRKEQSLNARGDRLGSIDSDSKTTAAIELQPEKQSFPIVRTELPIVNDCRRRHPRKAEEAIV